MLIQIKKNEAKEMLSTASNVMRALEQKIKTRTNKHQEVVQGLEASIRKSTTSLMDWSCRTQFQQILTSAIK